MKYKQVLMYHCVESEFGVVFSIQGKYRLVVYSCVSYFIVESIYFVQLLMSLW